MWHYAQCNPLYSSFSPHPSSLRLRVYLTQCHLATPCGAVIIQPTTEERRMTDHIVAKRWSVAILIGLALWIAARPIATQAQTASPTETPTLSIASPLPTVEPTQPAT